MHLGPSGEAAAHAVAEHVVGDVILELVDERWPLGTRPHKAHIPFDDVEELWPLVEVVLAQERADLRAPRVSVLRPHRAGLGFRVVHHGAELVNEESPAVHGHPFLGVENRSFAATKRDREHNRGKYREDGQSDQQRKSAGDNHHSLHQCRGSVHRRLVQGHDGDAVKILDAGAQGEALKEVGNDPDIDELIVQILHQIDHVRVTIDRQGHIHDIDPVRGDDLVRAIQRAENRSPGQLGRRARRLGKEAHHVESESLLGRELAGHGLTELRSSGHQDPNRVFASGP